MTIEEDNNLTETEDRAKALGLSLVTGGKGPPGTNWMSALPKGTIFLCRMRNTNSPEVLNPLLEEYHIIHKRTISTAILLYTNLNREEYIWVDPDRFCWRFELIEVIGEDP